MHAFKKIWIDDVQVMLPIFLEYLRILNIEKISTLVYFKLSIMDVISW